MQKIKFREPLLLASVLCVVPIMALVPGCGGGSNGQGLIPSTTPNPATTQASNMTLGNGQRAILTTTTRGTEITGTLQVLPPAVNPLRATTRALTYSFGVGTYQISGTFTAPRGFSITGTDGGQPLFTMTGQLSTATLAGSYSLTVDGQTDTGVIPKVGQAFPTTPPVTPPPTTITSNLTFSPSSDSNFVNAPLTTGTFTLVASANIVGGALQSDVKIGKDGVFLAFSGISSTIGSTANFGTFGASGYIYNYTPAGLIRNFVPESGSITLTAISQNSATFRFNNAVYAANSGNIARGKVTVNGTVTAPLKRF